MQLKIINERGNCRGRPPSSRGPTNRGPTNRGPTRDGPKNCRLSVVNCQLSIYIDRLKFDGAESTIKNALEVKRRWGEQGEVSGQRSAVSGLRPAVSSQQSVFDSWQSAFKLPDTEYSHEAETCNMFSALIMKWPRGEPEAVISRKLLVFGQIDQIPIADRRPPTRARDWPDRTCSENPYIIKDRYKHRWRTREKPAIAGGVGRLCLVAKKRKFIQKISGGWIKIPLWNSAPSLRNSAKFIINCFAKFREENAKFREEFIFQPLNEIFKSKKEPCFQ
jgi:hypothetical protein